MSRIIPKGSVHNENDAIVAKVEGLFHVVPFTLLRQTPSVDFHSIPFIERATGMERVIHAQGAHSPGAVDEVKYPWYMHPNQEDNLFTIVGTRTVELYHPDHGKIETFEVSKNQIKRNGVVILDEPGILGWPTGVFHRNSSLQEGGSSSLNMAMRFEHFNIDYEFNIYDIDMETGKARVIREGHLDQPK